MKRRIRRSPSSDGRSAAKRAQPSRMRAALLPGALLAALLLPVRPAGSYYDEGHKAAAAWALALLADRDAQAGCYAEVYHPALAGSPQDQRPTRSLVQGAADEDDGFVQGNGRAFRHFYDPSTDKGLRFAPYFFAWMGQGGQVTCPPHDDQGIPYYTNARDWARNGGGAPTLRNWEGAIAAYDYSAASRREAYWRLGHAVHLLTDMAEPDHAAARSHFGSGFRFPEDAEQVPLERVMGMSSSWGRIFQQRRAALVAAWRIRLAHRQTIGYELLVEQLVRSGSLQPKPAAILRRATLEQYFDEMARTSLDAIQQRRIGLPVGLVGGSDDPAQPWNSFLAEIANVRDDDPVGEYFSTLVDEGGVAGAGVSRLGEILETVVRELPAIEEGQRPRYAELAAELLSSAAGLNAGLLQDFYDIVNAPPYVEAVTITQWIGEQETTKYRAFWRPVWQQQQGIHDGQESSYPYRYEYPALVRRELIAQVDEPLQHNCLTRIAIEFGPRSSPPVVAGAAAEAGDSPLPVPERVHADSLQVSLGNQPFAGQLDAGGTRWTGQATLDLSQVENHTRAVRVDAQQLSCPLRIGARDFHHHLHLPGRRSLATHMPLDRDEDYQLDSNPATPARAQSQPPHNWIGYEPADDTCHVLRIGTIQVADGLFRGGLDPAAAAPALIRRTLPADTCQAIIQRGELRLDVKKLPLAAATGQFLTLSLPSNQRLGMVLRGPAGSPALSGVQAGGTVRLYEPNRHSPLADAVRPAAGEGRVSWVAYRQSEDEWIAEFYDWECPWPAVRGLGEVRFLLRRVRDDGPAADGGRTLCGEVNPQLVARDKAEARQAGYQVTITASQARVRVHPDGTAELLGTVTLKRRLDMPASPAGATLQQPHPTYLETEYEVTPTGRGPGWKGPVKVVQKTASLQWLKRLPDGSYTLGFGNDRLEPVRQESTAEKTSNWTLGSADGQLLLYLPIDALTSTWVLREEP